MSTRMLTTPGKFHELCDDLESLWFVTLYEGLHYLKHNKPSAIKMQTLFDHVDVCQETGTHVGGLGKQMLYLSGDIVMTRTLKFDSKAFSILIRRIYELFHGLNGYYDALDREKELDGPIMAGYSKLKTCAEMKRLLKEALDSEEWPESCDKVEDQYPPRKRMTHNEKDTIALSYVNRSLVTPEEASASGTKRKRGEDDEEENPPAFVSKRPKVQPFWERIRTKCVKFIWG